MSIYERLVYLRDNKVFGKAAYLVLKILGVEIPLSVKIGTGLKLHHGGMGVVIHPKSVIGENVSIYPGVTLGRADVYRSADRSKFAGIVIEDDVILGAGCKILCDDGVLTVGKNSVIGANAVLFSSTEVNDMWGGIPAKKIGTREQDA